MDCISVQEGRFFLDKNVHLGQILQDRGKMDKNVQKETSPLDKGEIMIKSSKFTEIDEEFICESCGKKVPKLGYSCRNHCPYCLHSKHVDKNPGDRQELCHGDLEPVSMEIDGKKGYVIVFRCKKCGQIRRNKAAKDDNMELLIDLSSKQI